MPYNFLKLIQSNSHIGSFNNFAFYPVSTKGEEEEEPDYPATTSLVYTLSNDGTYYIVGTGFTSIEAIEADTSGGTAGSGLDNTWTGGQLVIPSEHNGLPVKAIAPKAFNAVKNITEMYIYDGVTNIGHRAFQCLEASGFDTTMKTCRLPETLISLGGTTSSSGGRVFWGRKGLGNSSLVIPESITYFPTCSFSDTVIDSLTIKNGSFNTYCFQRANINNLIIGSDSANGVLNGYTFFSSTIGILSIIGTYEFKTSASGLAPFNPVIYASTINELYTDSRCTFSRLSFGSDATSDLSTIKIGHIKGNSSFSIEGSFAYINKNIDYKNSKVDITIDGTSLKKASGAFDKSNLRNVVVGHSQVYANDNAYVLTFGGKMQSLTFKNAQYLTTRMSTDKIKSTIDRLYLPELKEIQQNFFETSAVVEKIFIGYSNCLLRSLNANILKKHCYFKPESINNYSNGTNWSTFFVKDGNEEPQMFVYNTYASGDVLPTQIGTTQLFNVVWYEDDDFTIPAGTTATSNKYYFGKISAVV